MPFLRDHLTEALLEQPRAHNLSSNCHVTAELQLDVAQLGGNAGNRHQDLEDMKAVLSVL